MKLRTERLTAVVAAAFLFGFAFLFLQFPNDIQTGEHSTPNAPQSGTYGRGCVLLINGFQSVPARRFAKAISAQGFAGRVVLLRASAIGSAPEEYQDGASLFGPNESISLAEHEAVPLLLAQRFLTSADSSLYTKVLYVDPTEVSLCGDLFELFSDAASVYVVRGQWNFAEIAAQSVSHFLFGGSFTAVKIFLEQFLIAQSINRTKPTAWRIQVALLAVETTALPSDRVVEATPDVCLAVSHHPDACDARLFLAVVDKRRCYVEGREEFGNFCPTKFALPLYKLPNSSNPARLAALPAPIYEALVRYVPAPVPYLERTKQVAACPLGRRSAVLGMAANYHNRHAVFGDRLAPLVNSFLRSAARRCTDLVLFINGPRPPHPSWDRVVWVDMGDIELTERPKCNPTESRMEYFYEWLARNGALHYAMVAIVDVRDVFFQSDPFSSLMAWPFWENISSSREWILVPSESLSTRSRSAYLPKAFDFFKLWQDKVFGAPYRRLLSAATLPTGEALPIVNSGLILGTAQAMTELLAVMRALLRPTVDGVVCGVDQALLTMMVYDGLMAARFPAPVWIANPEFAIFRNGVERAADALWRNNTLVNCLGDRYSIVHQFEPSRHPWVWRYAMAAMHIEWGVKKAPRHRGA